MKAFISGIGDSRVKLWLDGKQDLEITGGEPYSYDRYEDIASTGYNSETVIDE